VNDRIDRRTFVERAVAALPLLHAGALVAAPRDEPMATPGTYEPSSARFARLRLRTHRLADLASFYSTTLGLPIHRTADDRIEITCGQTVLEFIQTADSTQPYYHFAFNIPQNKLDQAIAWMKPRCPLVKRNGSDEVVFHFENWNAHAIYFIDPAGNIGEFIARHTLTNDSPGDFGVPDILCASEIGVVTPNVRATVAEIENGVDIATYKGVSDDFAAVGDEQGLFIVVKTDRAWFNSDRKAEVFPAEAVVRGAKLENDLRFDHCGFVVTSSTLR